jgi:hypothetical protein
MTKASVFLRKKGALIFFPKADVWEDLLGIFLRPLIIYCIRYIEYAKVGNGPALRILRESII